jgi:Tol biopolymer transport system component
MRLATSTIGRTDERVIYAPALESGMVHRSALSPDKKWVLLVEMDGAGWLPCRLVPFDGSSAGREVGPPSACTWAQWSPNGKWMYFSAEARGSGFHIWRQAFPRGEAEQLTPSGATEEEGLAVAPDGRSVITAAGNRESSIWLHDDKGDHQLTTEGYVYLPTMAPDARKIYYVRRIPGSRSYVSGELWKVDVATATSERVLPGIIVSHYSLSPDGKRVVFAMAEGESRKGIWITDLDQTQAPRQLTKGKEYRVFFAGNDAVVYQSPQTKSHLTRINLKDGTTEEVNSAPILHLVSVSPEGDWATVVFAPEGGHGDRVTNVKVQPLRGGEPVPVCDNCMVGFGPSRTLAPIVAWTPDGRFQYLSLRYFGMQAPATLVLPLKAGRPVALNSINLGSEEQIGKLPGARLISREDVFPGPSPNVYVFTQRGAKSNLFRIYFAQ